jgi:hypothetical protein
VKSVLVASVGKDLKLYYVIDSTSTSNDGVLVIDGAPKIVNFWETAIAMRNLVPLMNSDFHKYLWDGGSDEDSQDRWERIFIKKTQSLEDSMTRGLTISTDVMKQKQKSKSINQRAFDFKSLLVTQNTSKIRGISGR